MFWLQYLEVHEILYVLYLFFTFRVLILFLIIAKPVLPFIELSEDASVFTGVDDSTTPVNFPTPFHFNDIMYSSAYVCYSNKIIIILVIDSMMF